MSSGSLILSLSEVAWAVEPLQSNEGSLSDRQAVLFISALFTIAGIVVLRHDAKAKFQKARKYLRMKTFDPQTATDTDRLVGISGTITDAEETLTAPLTETESVAYLTREQVAERDYKYDREERRRREASPTLDDDDVNKKAKTWSTEDATSESVPFVLDTAQGPVRVDPGEASLNMPLRETDLPSLPKRMLSNVLSVVTLGRAGGVNQRTNERYFEPGDDVLVIGDLDASPESDEYVATVDGAGAHNMFTVTPRSGRTLALRSTVVAMGSSIPGLALTLLGVGILVGGIVTGVV